MKVVVIGGGPAGMMAAITASKENDEVTLIEKNSRCGKKLLITGKGRCNITSSLNMDEFINNIPGNGRFLFSAFQNFTNEDILNMLHKNGVQTKEERGNRIFPLSDRSMDVLCAFERELRNANVNIITNATVKDIIVENGCVSKVKYIEDEKEKNIDAEKVILATGGKSYSITGSTGDGYEIAKRLGHTIEKIKPSLVPLTVSDESLRLCKEMQGLGLKNVEIKLFDSETSKIIYVDFGEMLFTHFGVSGPTILSSSAHLLRYKDLENKLSSGKIELHIDLKPALSEEKLEARIQRDFEKYKNKEVKNALDDLLPRKMINPIIELSNIDENKKINSVTKEERKRLSKILKDFPIEIRGFRTIEEAIITAGGVSIKEINPKTMESKIVKGLFFAGEIIDVDAYTGGFNLQIAYSTGYTAGKNE